MGKEVLNIPRPTKISQPQRINRLTKQNTLVLVKLTVALTSKLLANTMEGGHAISHLKEQISLAGDLQLDCQADVPQGFVLVLDLLCQNALLRSNYDP